MRLLITGSQGQLGRALMKLRPDAIGLSRAELDITQPLAVRAAIEEVKPDAIIHCAAWTQVDEAARQPEAAYRVNALGAQNVALAAARVSATLLYVSTNEVFDGTKSSPYLEFDRPNPINAYGASKLAGEMIVRSLLSRSYVVRVSWLTGAGGKNFVHRIQQLADERGSLRVVTDEVACPTFLDDVAPALLQLLTTEHFGIYHFVNQGFCSRYEFARHVMDWTNRAHIPIEPITLADFNRPSSPPKFSPLANLAGPPLGIQLPTWQESLQRFLRTE